MHSYTTLSASDNIQYILSSCGTYIIFCSCQTHNGCAGVRRIILPCELSSLEQQFKYRGYLEADVYIVNVTKHTKIKSLLAITFSFSYKVKQLQLYYISHMPILTFHNFTIMNTTLKKTYSYLRVSQFHILVTCTYFTYFIIKFARCHLLIEEFFRQTLSYVRDV